MNRKELIEKIYLRVKSEYEYFKDEVVLDNIEDFCEEMALMYNFKNYLRHIEIEEKDFTNTELEFINQELDTFIDTFMDIFYNSDFGNSYIDIKAMIKESIEEIFNNVIIEESIEEIFNNNKNIEN